ncbi:MAG: electron transfer flavoprotein subunit beta/FixA family protein [Trueperaceae bacterium]
MHIIVPIKQVPETSNVKMDPVTGTMIRAGVGTVVNPLDLFAIETAVRLKEAHGGRITTLTMGPRGADKALREAMAMGCDDGVLISDRAFAGSDSWATSYTLSQAIRKVGDFDLIVAGERATDGDTGQVGPGIAAWLDLPLATYVAAITRVEPARADAPARADVRGRGLTVERLVEEGYQVVDLPFPALITVVKEVAAPRLPTLRGKKRAKAAEIPLFTAADLDLEPGYLGLKGSPTKVVKVATPKVTRGGTLVRALDEDAVADAVDQLLAFLDARDLLPTGGRA